MNPRDVNTPTLTHPRFTFLKDISAEHAAILTPQALDFVADLAERFTPIIRRLLAERVSFAEALKNGKTLDFLPQTQAIRDDASWQVAPIPADLQNRRVEITGPVERKMMINALNSGAFCFMADLEDSLTPGWQQVMDGQLNLRDAVNKTIQFKSTEGKDYTLNDTTATLIVRPRGWHLLEEHMLFDNEPLHGALLDFGLYVFHNHAQLKANGTGPYYYLPKIEHHTEATLWNDIFSHTETTLGLEKSTIRATVLIETITAAFEMDEILYALKDYIVAQNAGRWDYIFSYIKNHSTDSQFVCPDRGQVTMTQPFLRHYSQLLIQTCHKRGALAMGGMAALIPIKHDEEANQKAMNGVKADKTREASDGHDGTWVAHPGLISIAKQAFDDALGDKLNQVDNKRADVSVSAQNLLEVPAGSITKAGVRNNIAVSIRYLGAWLSGLGCVPIFNLMEDAATAEISRTQLWQWIKHQSRTDENQVVDKEMFEAIRGEELAIMIQESPDHEHAYIQAADIVTQSVFAAECDAFITLPAYKGMLGAEQHR